MASSKKRLRDNDTPITLPFTPPQGTVVWKGPTEHGITQTMLSRYIVCPERFRVMYIEGVQPIPTFNSRIEFGNMWHLCEEGYAARQHELGAEWFIHNGVTAYAKRLCDEYPMEQEQINHWYQVCKQLFPVYRKYWETHSTSKSKPLFQEEKFCIDYKGLSRPLKVRGKWDSAHLVTTAKAQHVWLQENKTKSAIDREKICRQLKFDLQTMFYVVALEFHLNTVVKGVRYNVVRRSSHKTPESMMRKVEEDLRDDRVAEWFSRWDVNLTSNDIASFRLLCLEPILENLIDDYEWWSFCQETKLSVYTSRLRQSVFPDHQRRHYVTPYLGYNPLSEGGEGDIDQYIFNGNEVGLRRITSQDLFPELQ